MKQRRSVSLLALLLSFVLIAAACGDDSSSEPSEETQTPTETPAEEPTDQPSEEPGEEPTEEPTEELTASFKGVTEDTINVGVTMLDFALLVDINLSPAGWGDQQAVREAIFDSINERGGINGRMINAEYRFYSPISATSADEVCTELTQDYDLFAVIGGFVGPAGGTSDPCITGLNETILIGGEMNAEELADSVAPWYHAGQSVEEQTTQLLDLLAETGEADGENVYVIGGVAADAQREFVLAELADRGFNVVDNAVLGANDGDTVNQDTEMGPIAERVRTSDATAIFIYGNPSAILRGLIDAGIHEDYEIWNNNNAGLNNIGATFGDLSTIDGVISSGGLTDDEIWEQELFQTYCADPVRERVPEADLRPPLEYERNEENWFNSTRLACQDIFLFDIIATAAGPNLTQETFVEGANSLGEFEMPTGPESSLEEGKITARDLVRLTIYDHTVGDGQTKPFTDLVNVAG